MTIQDAWPGAAPPTPAGRTATGRLAAWVRAARPWQWHKNLLVFGAPAAAGLLTDARVVLDTAVAALAFILAAAGAYYINDAIDAAEDAQHPVKRFRPIACGLIDRRLAVVAGTGLHGAAVLVALTLTGGRSALVVAVYAALTAGYSMRLKHVPVVELLAVAAGFVLRAVAGGVAADVRISLWFFLVATAGAIFLTVGKRTAEHLLLAGHRASLRRVLDVYSHRLLRSLLLGCGLLTFVSFALWSVDTRAEGLATAWTPLAIVPLAVLLARYSWLAEQGRGGEPELLILRDRVLVISGVALGALLIGGLHLA